MALVMLTTASLLVGYSRCGVPPFNPAMLSMLTIDPRISPPFHSMAGIAYFAILTILETLSSRPAVQSAMSTSTAVPLAADTPTLLTSMSSRPNSSRVRWTAASQSRSKVTSSARATAFPAVEHPLANDTVFCAQDWSRSRQMTLQPLFTSVMAIALSLPMPSPAQPAPVTIAAMPAKDREGKVKQIQVWHVEILLHVRQ